jgi:hypothetical protein
MEWVDKVTLALDKLGFGGMTLKSLIFVALFPISNVYVAGRVLMVVKWEQHRVKNIIAFASLLLIIGVELLGIISEVFETALFLYCLGVLFYVLLFQRLYGRVDHVLDSKLGTDDEVIVEGKPSKRGKK